MQKTSPQQIYRDFIIDIAIYQINDEDIKNLEDV